MLKLPRPPLVEEKLLAVVDGEWRTAREIHALLDEGAPVTVITTMIRLADAGKVARRYDPHRNGQIARYRKVTISADYPAHQEEQPCQSKS